MTNWSILFHANKKRNRFVYKTHSIVSDIYQWLSCISHEVAMACLKILMGHSCGSRVHPLICQYSFFGDLIQWKKRTQMWICQPFCPVTRDNETHKNSIDKMKGIAMVGHTHRFGARWSVLLNKYFVCKTTLKLSQHLIFSTAIGHFLLSPCDGQFCFGKKRENMWSRIRLTKQHIDNKRTTQEY